MLIFKCGKCRKKLFRYHKIGQGEVHRCHKERIKKVWNLTDRDGKAWCVCGNDVGIDRGSYYTMNKKAVTYSGTKTNG